MAGQTVQSNRLWTLARRDHWVLSREELLAHGVTRHGIEWRVRTGALYPKARGVYAVRRPDLTREGRWMVAIKACGNGAALAGLSAAVHLGIRKRQGRRIEVVVPPERNPRPPGIAVSRRAVEVIVRNGIPVTTPLQTLIDIAPRLQPRQREAAIKEADALDLIAADALHAALHGRSEPGACLLREILDPLTFVLTDTELERLFLAIARAAGLPKPQSQVVVNGHRVDFYFPALNLVVECDSLRYHRTALHQRNDLLRDQAHAAADTEWIRFSHHQIAHEPAYVEATLRRVASRISAASSTRAAASA